MESLLEVQNLKTQFATDDGTIYPVDGISLKIEKGKTLGLVGESGCGKSETSLTVLRLVAPPGKITEGTVRFNGTNLLELSNEQMRKIRGNEIAMIFQEPMSSLNPVYTIGNQIIEVIRLHKPQLSKNQIYELAIQMLKKVGIPSAEARFDEFPHSLSGGMRQRVMIAMALCCNPKLLIADEPTTALDVTIQAQILMLMKDLQIEYQMGILLITHDLGVVAQTCDEVAIMYAGKIVEVGPVKTLFAKPKHPYTRGLLDSIPHHFKKQTGGRLKTIAGTVPSLYDLPKGCRFQNRCDKVQEKCKNEEPLLKNNVRCFFPIEEAH
jgi:oligopeptide/dipeptide ABC transporter ATP-binding protein